MGISMGSLGEGLKKAFTPQPINPIMPMPSFPEFKSGKEYLDDLAKADPTRSANREQKEKRERSKSLQEQIAKRREAVEGREAVDLPKFGTYQASTISGTPKVNTSEDLRAQTLDMTQRLANEEVPSTAMAQHRLATDRGLQQQLALASASRDPRAVKDAMNAQARLQSEASLQSGLIRSQEAQRQQQALASAIGAQTGIRGQDIQAGTSQAQLQMQRNLANQQALQQAAKDAAAAGNQQLAMQYQGQLSQLQQKDQAIRDLFQQENTSLGMFQPGSAGADAAAAGGLISAIGSFF